MHLRPVSLFEAMGAVAKQVRHIKGLRIKMASRISKQRGVTLVELVVTIVLMGILAGGTVAFVISSTQSYVIPPPEIS